MDNDKKSENQCCPLCGSENIEWVGDCFDEDNPTPYHCHSCDRFIAI